MAIALTLVPGPCVGVACWSPTDVASGQSALAAVFAGFVFGGIVVVLSVRAGHGKQSGSALKLLFCTFFGLTVVAADASPSAGGLADCARASAVAAVLRPVAGTVASASGLLPAVLHLGEGLVEPGIPRPFPR
jgi:hypothetical protein